MNKKICKECGQDIPEAEGVKIVSKYDSEKVLFQSTKTTIKEAVIEAIASDADLSNANLRCADLGGADLSNANLRCADLSNANLRDADLRDAKTTMCKVNFSAGEYEQAKQFIEGLK